MKQLKNGTRGGSEWKRILSAVLAATLLGALGFPASARESERRPQTVTVDFYTGAGTSGNLHASRQIPLGTSLGSDMPSPPRMEGGVFAGWSTLPDKPEINFDRSVAVDRDLPVYAVWQVKVTVEHYVYVGSVQDSVLKDTDAITAYSTESVPIKIRHYSGYVFDESHSALEPALVGGAPTIRLYYRMGSYRLGALPQVTVDVEDRYASWPDPALTLAKFASLAEACTVSSTGGAALSQVEFATLTSPDFANLKRSEITAGYDQAVTLAATWANGDGDSKTVRVKVADRKAPQVTVARRKLTRTAGSAAMSEAELIRAFSAEGRDNYDGPVKLDVGCLGLEGVRQIRWDVPGDYVVYLTGTDSSGNQSRKACVVSISE